MWLVSDRGLYSVVDKGQTPGKLCVGARVGTDLKEFRHLPPMQKYATGINESILGGYRFRINFERQGWGAAVAQPSSGPGPSVRMRTSRLAIRSRATGS